MKKKALVALACAGIASAFVLTSCTGSAEYLYYSPNWDPHYQNNELTQPIHEEYEYEIKFYAGSGLNSNNYTVAYCTDENEQNKFGKYFVELDGTVNGTYTLVQDCTVPVTYFYGGEAICLDNVVHSEVEFGMTSVGLRPIRSFKKLLSYSPTNGTPNSLDTFYRTFDYDIEIVYNGDATATESIKINDYEGTFLGYKTETAEPYASDWFGIDYAKYSYLDNEQLYFAFRGLSDSAMQSTSHVNSYDESSNRVRTLIISAAAQGNTTDFQNATVNGVAIGETPVAYNAITLAVDSTNNGASQELWYASQSATIAGKSARNLLLKIKTNIHYSVGALEYNLKSVDWLD